MTYEEDKAIRDANTNSNPANTNNWPHQARVIYEGEYQRQLQQQAPPEPPPAPKTEK
jgi:hypothetical protein